MFFHKSDIKKQKNKTRQGSWPQKSELGMHQNSHFQQHPLKNVKNPEIKARSTLNRQPYFLVWSTCRCSSWKVQLRSQIHTISKAEWCHWPYLQAPPLPPTSKNWMNRFFGFLMGFHWKWGCWCIPSSDFCGQHPCRFLCVCLKVTFAEKQDFCWLLNDFS